MLQQEPTPSSAIFEVLPNELIGEILSHISHVELIFNTSHVCKCWRNLCGEYILQGYEKTFNSLSENSTRQVDLNGFLESVNGRKFKKYLLRKEAFEFASKLARNSTKSVDIKSCFAMERWVDAELSILKGYFNIFTDMEELPMFPIRKPTVIESNQAPPSSFFGNTLSFLGSLFSKSNNTTNVNQTVTSEQPPKSEFDYLTKVLLDGDYASGKTSLLNCAMNDTPVNASMNSHMTTIGIDFAIKSFHIGETTKIKLQLWDQCGPERFRSITSAYYKNSSVILLLVDPSSEYSTLESMNQKLTAIKENAPKAEVILITTKKDQNNERLISNEIADKYAFENFGGLHLDITNTNIEEPSAIIWYCAILKYLLAPGVGNKLI
ncbi:rab family small GTPase [Naegleria gruberi]|uniref:Rab family small GTPase n=1 Tax=Naegleria gruberi TaxID=5762 RepID=D2VFW7_NAEGR|nr:rab family small GTPase [Naegleria gruberi]EFC44260.1 rab family small GTPase [Naegleria gruberi]|eukprot:XP_002677004.1 rab family small GTPase [Naegleria gruberi strain NEG-M]